MMDDWFTVEEIDAQTFAISEYRHWEETHCYLLCGRETALLPDREYLFSGDLIYKGCLYAFYPTTDPRLFHESVKRVQKYKIKRVLPGHHQLNIPVAMIDEIEAGFAGIEREGRLKRGSGLFDFKDFQIYI